MELRRSEILNIDGDISMEDLIPNEGDYRQPQRIYQANQTPPLSKRGGKGVIFWAVRR